MIETLMLDAFYFYYGYMVVAMKNIFWLVSLVPTPPKGSLNSTNYTYMFKFIGVVLTMFSAAFILKKRKMRLEQKLVSESQWLTKFPDKRLTIDGEHYGGYCRTSP